MGTRLNFIIANQMQGKPAPAAVLYCNNSHQDINALDTVKEIAKESFGPTSMVRQLLQLTYPSPGGNHFDGDFVFSLDTAPHDNEEIYTVMFMDGPEKPCVEITDSHNNLVM